MNRFSLSSLIKGTKIFVVCLYLFVFASFFFLAGKYITQENIKKVLSSKDKNLQQEESNIDTPLPYADIQSQEVIASIAKLCSNTVYGFELAYPKEWFTTYNRDDEKCRYFAPYSFIVPQDTDQQFVPIKIEVASIEDWQQIVSLYSNPNDFQNVISVKNLELNSRLVQKINSQTTGEGILPKNLNKTTYLVFNSSRPLVISYQQLELEEDSVQYELFLEDMVKSINFF